MKKLILMIFFYGLIPLAHSIEELKFHIDQLKTTKDQLQYAKKNQYLRRELDKAAITLLDKIIDDICKKNYLKALL